MDLTENGRKLELTNPGWGSAGWNGCESLRSVYNLFLSIAAPEDGIGRRKGRVFRPRDISTDVNVDGEGTETSHRHIW
jgi:hypothetical protein